jgi:hypothetical protein
MAHGASKYLPGAGQRWVFKPSSFSQVIQHPSLLSTVLPNMARFLTSAFVLLAASLSAMAQASSGPPAPTSSPIPLPGVQINPIGSAGKCVEVRGGVFANGTPVQVYVHSLLLVLRSDY